jgi:hypothetical protein
MHLQSHKHLRLQQKQLFTLSSPAPALGTDVADAKHTSRQCCTLDPAEAAIAWFLQTQQPTGPAAYVRGSTSAHVLPPPTPLSATSNSMPMCNKTHGTSCKRLRNDRS